MERCKLIILLLLIFIVNHVAVIAQDSPKDVILKGKNSILIGYNYNKYNFGELGIVRGLRGDGGGDITSDILAGLYFQYMSLSSEFLIDNKLVVCPKLGYHITFLGLALGVNLLDYTDFNDHKLGCRPEIGLSLGGAFGVHYGYTITSKNDNFNYCHPRYFKNTTKSL